jgi:hypothetical protein
MIIVEGFDPKIVLLLDFNSKSKKVIKRYNVVWLSPLEGWLKFYFDEAKKGKPGEVGYGDEF